MDRLEGEPLAGAALEKLKGFLHACGLRYDPCIRYTVCLMDDDEIAATGSLDGNTVKCVAVSPAHQGEDLTAQVLTALIQRAAQQGVGHLMLYTKPMNQYLFTPLGFHPVIRTADVLVMENRRGGLQSFLQSLPRPADAEKPERSEKPVGCIVANANPFTLGHRYLVETAARECAWVHVFILSEDRGLFSPETRLQMAREGCRDLGNVLIHPSGPYMVSSATFPSYFIKDRARAEDIRCEADVRLFGQKIAPALGVTRRYVGTEPGCAVTAQYNETLKNLLPACGVQVVEVPRKAGPDGFISASKVRALLSEGRTDELAYLLPETTLRLLG